MLETKQIRHGNHQATSIQTLRSQVAGHLLRENLFDAEHVWHRRKRHTPKCLAKLATVSKGQHIRVPARASCPQNFNQLARREKLAKVATARFMGTV